VNERASGHEARMVVSGGTKHALTVLRTGRIAAVVLRFPGFCPRRPLLSGRTVCRPAGHRGETKSTACPGSVHAPQSIGGLRQNCIPLPATRPRRTKECLECFGEHFSN